MPLYCAGALSRSVIQRRPITRAGCASLGDSLYRQRGVELRDADNSSLRLGGRAVGVQVNI